MIGLIAIALVAAGLVAFRSGSTSSAPATSATASTTSGASGAAAAQTPRANPALVAKAQTLAEMGPHKQATYPAIPFQNAASPRSREVIASAYQFAAEHPEILSYVPCFCGCERSGHGGNHDCFVKQRAADGEVLAWDEHGVECTVCIDVANRSRQMHASGASVRDIRAAIDKEFGALYPAGRNMPTPHPPGAH